MSLRILISLSLALFAGLAVHAQTAEDFFNGGAQLYISNNIPAALDKTEAGLRLYPDNVKLKKLEQLLKQKQQQQSRQNQKQKQQNQQQQNSDNQNNQSQQKRQKNQQKQNQSEQQKRQQQAQSSARQAKEKQGGKKETAQAMMTPEEARRLLDTQKGNEQYLQLKPKAPPPNSQQPIEDW